MRRLKFFLILLFLAGPAHAFQDGKPQDLPREALVIQTASGTYEFRVQIAKTPDQQRTGLMFRRSMPDDEGMLFPYRFPTQPVFWMMNTYIPLDLIFIRSDGTIARIVPNATPMSQELIESGGYVNGVLEINGGLAEKLGITAGDKIRHPFFEEGEIDE